MLHEREQFTQFQNRVLTPNGNKTTLFLYVWRDVNLSVSPDC
jgi:hypothetical protein